MILVFGALLDSTIGHIVHRLVDRGVPFVLLDPREHCHRFELSWEWSGGGFRTWLRQDGRVTPLEDVRAACVHHIWLPSRDEVPDGHVTLRAFLETAPFLVCNRPSASATNYAKTWQQKKIAACGFAVPRTLVTNIPEEARDFYQRCRRRVIYKSLSARRSIVRRMTDTDLERLDRLRAGPAQFQEWVPGVDIRVHVMGRRVYATEVSTEATDYRYSSRDGLPRTMRGVQLPDEIAGWCVAVARSLGLVSAGVDLRRTPDGQWFCFEANPTPAFAFYEQYTGQRIADGLINALLEGGIDYENR